MAEEVLEGYRLLNCLYPGQESEVWEVVEQASHRHFAMKLLLPKAADDPDAIKMMKHEAKIGMDLTHPNVIKIHYVSESKTKHFFVMDYFPAGSLKVRLLRKQYDFIREHVHSIFKQAATAMAYMNATGWVHRDIKPENMLVNSAGELKMIDFALAQKIRTPSFWDKIFRTKGKVQGTRSYMSPEQIRGEALDGRADIYSFGAAAYELTTYRTPFRAATSQELLQKHILEKPMTPKSHVPELTDEFCNLVLKMLAKKRDDRPQSFHEVLKALNAMKIYKTPPPAPKKTV